MFLLKLLTQQEKAPPTRHEIKKSSTRRPFFSIQLKLTTAFHFGVGLSLQVGAEFLFPRCLFLVSSCTERTSDESKKRIANPKDIQPNRFWDTRQNGQNGTRRTLFFGVCVYVCCVKLKKGKKRLLSRANPYYLTVSMKLCLVMHAFERLYLQ